MKITVAICTWNRADLLDMTLKSLREAIDASNADVRVIVADNNSSDHTQAVLESHSKWLPLTTLFVREQGKSFALNQIIDRLEGDLVLWTDDDVLFDRNWINAYADAAARWPHAEFFGGWVCPLFLGAEPNWLRPAWKTISGVFAARELGDEPFEFTAQTLPFGANLAMRVATQKRYTYNTGIGRRGELLLAGEETQLMKQMVHEGVQGMWVPESRVRHLITPDRTEVDHIERFYFGLGNTQKAKDLRRSSLGRLANGACQMTLASFNEVVHRFTDSQRNPRRWIRSRAKASYCWGRSSIQFSGIPDRLKPSQMTGRQKKSSQPRFRTDANLHSMIAQRPASAAQHPSARLDTKAA